MSIATAITNAQNKVAACYTSVDTMGGTLPETQNLTNLPTAIESIPTGGGTTYPGLDTDYNNGLATINKGALADYSVSDITETGCIAKYGNIYNNFKIFGNPTINFNTGVISGFGYNDYIQLPQSIPTATYCSTMDMIFLLELTDVSSISPIISQSSALRFIGTNSETSTYSIYIGSWVNGTTVLENNKKYWFRVTFDGTTWRGYLLADDDYILSQLPDISQWSQEWTTTTDIFRGQTLVIGRNIGQSSQYIRGSDNLSQAVIYVNNVEWWNARGNSAIVYSNNIYQQTYGLLNTSIPSGTPELQINYNPVDRNYALGERNAVVASIVGNKSYVWGNGGLLNFSGYSNYPSYSISPSWGFAGSPTYNSSNMSYSGFSNDNYIATNYTFSMDTTQFTKGFTIQAHVKTPSSFTGYYNKIFSCGTQYTYGPFLALNANGGGVYFAISSGGSILLSINVSTALSVNTEYWIRIVKPDTRYFSNNTMLQLSTDGENWNTIGTSAETISTTVSADMKMILGVGGASYPTHIFTGNIYLDGTFIEFNNGDNTTTRVWDMVEETTFTPEPTPPTRVYNNFTTVGSPTINQSTGVVSGFSSSDYLKLPQVFNPSSNTWEVMFKATTGNIQDDAQWLIGSGILGTDYQGFTVGFEFDKPCFYLSETGESWDLAGYTEGTTTLSDNTLYYFKLQFTGTEYILSLSTDGTNWNTEATVQSSTPIYVSQSPLAVGCNMWNNDNDKYWRGSIDLSESYIKINGSTWWVGYTES